jgi:hypothetical protein
MQRPGRFAPGKYRVPIEQEAGWAPGPFGTGAENLDPTGIRFPDSPPRSESLYRPRYHGSYSLINKLPLALRPNAGHGLLIREVSGSHTTMYHSRHDSSGGMISPSHRPQHNTHKRHSFTRRDSNPQSQHAGDRLRPRGQWNRQIRFYCLKKLFWKLKFQRRMTRITLSMFTHLYAVSYQKLATGILIFDAKDTREDIFKCLVNVVDGRISLEYFTYSYSYFKYLCSMCEVPGIAVHSWSVPQQRIHGTLFQAKFFLLTEGYKNIMDKSNNAVLWKKQ